MSKDTTAKQVSSLRAVAHPVRLQILSLLTGSEMSAAEIARELGLTHANASYHLHVLASSDLLEVAGEEKIRGGVAKRYRHPWDRVESGPQSNPADRDSYVRALADELVRRFASREPQGSSWLADAEMWVAPDVWEQVTSLVKQAATLIHAQARPPRTEGTVHVNLTAAAFEMADR